MEMIFMYEKGSSHEETTSVVDERSSEVTPEQIKMTTDSQYPQAGVRSEPLYERALYGYGDKFDISKVDLNADPNEYLNHIIEMDQTSSGAFDKTDVAELKLMKDRIMSDSNVDPKAVNEQMALAALSMWCNNVSESIGDAEKETSENKWFSPLVSMEGNKADEIHHQIDSVFNNQVNFIRSEILVDNSMTKPVAASVFDQISRSAQENANKVYDDFDRYDSQYKDVIEKLDNEQYIPMKREIIVGNFNAEFKPKDVLSYMRGDASGNMLYEPTGDNGKEVDRKYAPFIEETFSKYPNLTDDAKTFAVVLAAQQTRLDLRDSGGFYCEDDTKKYMDEVCSKFSEVIETNANSNSLDVYDKLESSFAQMYDAKCDDGNSFAKYNSKYYESIDDHQVDFGKSPQPIPPELDFLLEGEGSASYDAMMHSVSAFAHSVSHDDLVEGKNSYQSIKDYQGAYTDPNSIMGGWDMASDKDLNEANQVVMLMYIGKSMHDQADKAGGFIRPDFVDRLESDTGDVVSYLSMLEKADAMKDETTKEQFLSGVKSAFDPSLVETIDSIKKDYEEYSNGIKEFSSAWDKSDASDEQKKTELAEWSDGFPDYVTAAYDANINNISVNMDGDEYLSKFMNMNPDMRIAPTVEAYYLKVAETQNGQSYSTIYEKENETKIAESKATYDKTIDDIINCAEKTAVYNEMPGGFDSSRAGGQAMLEQLLEERNIKTPSPKNKNYDMGSNVAYDNIVAMVESSKSKDEIKEYLTEIIPFDGKNPKTIEHMTDENGKLIDTVKPAEKSADNKEPADKSEKQADDGKSTKEENKSDEQKTEGAQKEETAKDKDAAKVTEDQNKKIDWQVAKAAEEFSIGEDLTNPQRDGSYTI